MTHARDHLAIGGFVPFSAIDYPDHLSAVIFCQGCPWRCGYCHNAHLQPPAATASIRWAEVMDFLGKRHNLLDAVVFSGGEPTLQCGLAAAMRDVRALGFKVGLHTAGIYPRRIAEVLPLVDWVGFDVKAGFAAYERVTGVPLSGFRARESASHVLASGVAHEFRTTVDASLLGPADLDAVRAELTRMGVKRYVLQPSRSMAQQLIAH